MSPLPGIHPTDVRGFHACQEEQIAGDFYRDCLVRRRMVEIGQFYPALWPNDRQLVRCTVAGARLAHARARAEQVACCEGASSLRAFWARIVYAGERIRYATVLALSSDCAIDGSRLFRAAEVVAGGRRDVAAARTQAARRCRALWTAVADRTRRLFKS